MIIKKLLISNFRNYEKAEVQFHEKVNLITGENARGKTNLLEAIYLSSLGKSFRAAADNEMIRFGEESCHIKVIAERDNEDKIVEITIGTAEKSIKVDSQKIKKTAEMVDHILIVVFSPEDLRIVKETPERRRKFIDRELCQIKPAYYANLVMYKRVLAQRNACLREGTNVEEMLGVWDEQLIHYGTAIIAERERFIQKLDKLGGKIHKDITDGKETLTIQYKASIPYQKDPQKLKEHFEAALCETRLKDIARGATSRGPHRDDLDIRFNDIDMRHFGSQGQQRTAALSMKLAELALIEEETGEKAVLLLDDVLSELDAGRQTFLIRSMAAVQIFITAAEISETIQESFANGKVFEIKDGRIEEKAQT